MYNNNHSYNYNSKSGNSGFYDNTKKNTNLNTIQYNRKSLKRKRFLRLLLVDIILASVGLIIFILFHQVIPTADYMAPVALAQPNEISIASTTEPSSQTNEQSQNNADNVAAAANPAPEPMLNNAFADKFTDGEVIATDSSYQSKNINFTIIKAKQGDIVYYVADIYLRDISNFRTAFAQDQYGDSISDSIQNIAGDNNALLALTGDYYSAHSEGVVIRNSILYRDAVWRDVLIMYNDGSMETYSKEEFNLDEVIAKGAYQAWSFGPMLLDNGMPMTEFDSNVKAENPRSAIGYYEPGHYCFVAVDGRGQSGSPGMTMKELSQLFYDLGCSAAYNLDGGGSAKMMYMDGMVNHPSSRSREISDILMIVEDTGEEP